MLSHVSMENSLHKVGQDGCNENCSRVHDDFVDNEKTNGGIKFQNQGDEVQRNRNYTGSQNSQQIEECDRYLDDARNSWEVAKNIGLWSRKEEEVVEELCRRRRAAIGECRRKGIDCENEEKKAK